MHSKLPPKKEEVLLSFILSEVKQVGWMSIKLTMILAQFRIICYLFFGVQWNQFFGGGFLSKKRNRKKKIFLDSNIIARIICCILEKSGYTTCDVYINRIERVQYLITVCFRWRWDEGVWLYDIIVDLRESK